MATVVYSAPLAAGKWVSIQLTQSEFLGGEMATQLQALQTGGLTVDPVSVRVEPLSVMRSGRLPDVYFMVVCKMMSAS